MMALKLYRCTKRYKADSYDDLAIYCKMTKQLRQKNYIAKHEIFKAARRAGFSESVALYLMDSDHMPDWIVGDGGIIPSIPTPDEEED